ncbi:MAG: H/ACA ribonucleoprotein complex subunit GAR1 [Nitrososphaerales archaeon]
MIISKTIVIYLQEVGEVLHIAKSGRIIVKLSQKVNPGDIFVDAKGRKIAKVVELIGPIKSPYASAMPSTDRVKKYIGIKVYRGGKY